MFKKIVCAAAAGILALAPIQAARADSTCTGSGSLSFCFNYTFSANSFQLTYTSGGGFLTEVGLWGYNSITGPVTAAVTPNTKTCGWSDPGSS